MAMDLESLSSSLHLLDKPDSNELVLIAIGLLLAITSKLYMFVCLGPGMIFVDA